MKKIFAQFCLMLPFFAVAQETIPMYVGTYTAPGKSLGIYTYALNLKDGSSTKIAQVETPNPSFLAKDKKGKFLYAVNELEGGKGAVSAFSIDQGKLTYLNTLPSEGDAPCFVALHPSGNWLSVANYAGGSLTTFDIASDGSLEKRNSHLQFEGQGVDPVRQTAPHVHSTFFNKKGTELFVQDLGLDQITVFKTDKSGRLVDNKEVIFTNPGSGPRHIAFSKNEKYMYVILEMTGRIGVYERQAGKWVFQQDIDLNPSDFVGENGAAEIKVSPDGKFIYASNRGTANLISIYKIQNNGLLENVAYVPVLGQGPRNFNFTPNGQLFLVANQNTDNIRVFKRDITSGLLTDTGQEISVHAPVCIIF